jgi:hypothetical protein
MYLYRQAMIMDDLYHGCCDCSWTETIWSPVFGEYLCWMCLAKRTEKHLAMPCYDTDADRTRFREWLADHLDP